MQIGSYLIPFGVGFSWDRFIFKFIPGVKILRGRSDRLLMSGIDAIDLGQIEYLKIADISDKKIHNFLANMILSVDGSDFRDAIKRQLNLALLEILPKIYRLKLKSNINNKYVCDAQLHELLKEFDIQSEISFLMTLYYDRLLFFVRKAYSILRGWILIESKFDKPRLYVFRNPGKEKILWVAQSSHRNRGFFNQALFLKTHYECYFLNTESSWEPDEILGLEEIKLDWLELEGLGNFVYSYSNGANNSSSLNRYLMLLSDRIISLIGPGIKCYVALFKKIFGQFSIDLCVMGLSGYWINAIALTVSRENRVRTAFLQDIFFIEGCPPLDVKTDYVLSFQRSLEFKSQHGFPKVIRNLELEEISIGREGDGHCCGYQAAREQVSDRSGFSIKDRIVVLVALHPVCEPLTSTRKYIMEKSLLKELAGEPIFVIVKTHPQDSSGITNKILGELEAGNMWLVQDFDFELYLQACDLFIGTASTSVHQAIISGKVVAVMNYGSETLFPTAIKCEAAFSLEKEGDAQRFLRRPLTREIIEKNKDQYLRNHHKLDKSQEKIHQAIKKILED
jgi:hypothetical protein